MMDQNGVFKWGKYKGTHIRDIEEDYLRFLIDSNSATVKRCKEELDRRALINEAEEPLVKRLINTGFRELAKTRHPDAGGDAAEFRELQAAKELILGAIDLIEHEKDEIWGN